MGRMDGEMRHIIWVGSIEGGGTFTSSRRGSCCIAGCWVRGHCMGDGCIVPDLRVKSNCIIVFPLRPSPDGSKRRVIPRLAYSLHHTAFKIPTDIQLPNHVLCRDPLSRKIFARSHPPRHLTQVDPDIKRLRQTVRTPSDWPPPTSHNIHMHAQHDGSPETRNDAKRRFRIRQEQVELNRAPRLQRMAAEPKNDGRSMRLKDEPPPSSWKLPIAISSTATATAKTTLGTAL